MAVMDCCHSGTGLDLPYELQQGRWREETNPYHCVADVQLFSGCTDSQTSADVASAYSRPGGAMTTAFCAVFRKNPAPMYSELLRSLHEQMISGGFTQRPNLTSTQRFETTRVFIMDDILTNTNLTLGRTFRRKFPPNPRPMDDRMQEMVGAGVVAVGTCIFFECLFNALFG